MIITEPLLRSILINRDINILVYGSDISFIDSCIQLSSYKLLQFHKLDYFTRNSIYYIDVSLCKKKNNIIELLKELCVSPNFYYMNSFKKVIILVRFDKIRDIYQQAIKTIMDTSYLSCQFILHTDNINSVDTNILSRVLVLSLPIRIQYNQTTQMTMNKLIRLLKKPINHKMIDTIREICYMYYMDHKDSVDLQKLIIQRICSNYYLPNPIKYNIINEITTINYLYQYSYRKPIFLEWTLVSLFKHLRNYTTNLT